MKPITRRVFALLFAAGATVWGQAPSPDRSAPIQLGGVNITGSLRSRIYFWDWFQPTAGNNSYQYSGNLFRLGFSQNKDSWDWNAEFAVPFLLGLPTNPTGTGAQQGA